VVSRKSRKEKRGKETGLTHPLPWKFAASRQGKGEPSRRFAAI
jgi:hypothetical protein